MHERMVPTPPPHVSFIASASGISRPSMAEYSEMTQTVSPAPLLPSNATISDAVWAVQAGMGLAISHLAI